jgi:tetratricopeptide (TPR) repeat protein/TolB-like protein
MKKLFFYRILLFTLLFIFLSTPAIAKTMNILVYPFENTGDKQYSWISAGMTDTVITDLMGIREVSVISNADRRKIMEETKFILSGLVGEETMVKVGKLTGANIIFTGSYLVSKNNIRVNAHLINVETGRAESSAKIDGTLEKIFDLQDKVILTLLSETTKVIIPDVKQVRITEVENQKIQEKPKPQTTAYELYAKGLELKDTNPKEALTYYKKALEMDRNYVSALIRAGFTAGSTLNLFDEALGYLTRADNILKSRKATNTNEYADLMRNIGIVYSSKGDLDRALRYYMDFQQIQDRLGLQNTEAYAKFMNNTGIVYWSKGDLDHALRYFMDSQQIRDRLGLQNTIGYANLMMNIGIVYSSKGDLDRALRYYMDSQQIQDRLGLQNTIGYANLMGNIGNVYQSKGDLDRGLEYQIDCQQIQDRLGLQNTAGYAILMLNIGVVYYSKGNLDRALRYYTDCQQIRDRLGLQNTAYYADLLSNIGLLYEKKGDKEMAGRYYRNSYDIYVRTGYIGLNRDNALRNAQRLGY